MGVQFGPNLIPVHVVAGQLTYDGLLTVDVRQVEPEWWTADTVEQRPVIERDLPQLEFAMANQGQVKHMVRMAALAIKLAKQNNPALLILQDKVDELWSFALSLPMTGNFVPCNQGQLKHIALTFYDTFTNGGTGDGGVLFPTNGQTTLAWSAFTTGDRNYAPVNIGQVKALFGFIPIRSLESNASRHHALYA